jgi:hypothetical protein
MTQFQHWPSVAIPSWIEGAVGWMDNTHDSHAMPSMMRELDPLGEKVMILWIQHEDPRMRTYPDQARFQMTIEGPDGRQYDGGWETEDEYEAQTRLSEWVTIPVPDTAGKKTAKPRRRPKAVKKVRQKPGRKPGDPTNTGPGMGISVPCWWGCGATIYGSTLRPHWRDCPNRPARPKKAAE